MDGEEVAEGLGNMVFVKVGLQDTVSTRQLVSLLYVLGTTT
jgi:hypothetical protein